MISYNQFKILTKVQHTVIEVRSKQEVLLNIFLYKTFRLNSWYLNMNACNLLRYYVEIIYQIFRHY